MNLKTKPVEYKDGTQSCLGYLAWDESVADPKPCVLINHAWGGRDSFAEDKAIHMAAMGYVGFALDNYGDHLMPEKEKEKEEVMMSLVNDRAALLKRLKAGYKAAADLPEVDESHMAAIGYCFGGLCTLDMVRGGLDLKAAVSFHGLLGAPDYKPKKSSSKVLICHGWDDPFSTHANVVAVADEMTKMGLDWQLHAYGGTSHAFTVPNASGGNGALKYNEDADRRSWTATTELLTEVFGAHGLDQA